MERVRLEGSTRSKSITTMCRMPLSTRFFNTSLPSAPQPATSTRAWSTEVCRNHDRPSPAGSSTSLVVVIGGCLHLEESAGIVTPCRVLFLSELFLGSGLGQVALVSGLHFLLFLFGSLTA